MADDELAGAAAAAAGAVTFGAATMCGASAGSAATGAGYGFNYTFIKHAGFSAWGEANDIVMLFPQKDATKQTCWDGYGWGGPLWATKRGGQMAAVRRLISHVAAGHIIA